MVQRIPKTGKPPAGKKIRWIARYRDHAGTTHSKTFDRQDDAKAHEDQQREKLRNGTWISPAAQKTTVGALFDQWAARPVRDGTRTQYAWTRAQLGPLADIPALKLRATDVDAWYRQLTTGRPWVSKQDTGISPNTAREHVVRLSSAMGAAVKDGLLVRNPVRIPKRADGSDDVVRESMIPPEADIARIVALARDGGARYVHRDKVITTRPNPTLASMVLTAVGTGMRISEICGLQVRDVDFLRRAVRVEMQASTGGGHRVPVKTPAGVRRIPVSDDLLQVLGPHCKDRGPDEALFVTAVGSMWRGTSAARALARVSGDTGWHFHSFRHYYASRLIASGVSVRTVQAVMGHDSASTTLRVYTHLWDDADDTTRAAITGAVEGARGISGGFGLKSVP